MAINVSARKARLLIGGQDWSTALLEISPWQSSSIDGSGLVKTTATITLIETRDNPGSLDDRINNVFRVGNTVIISVTNSSGTLQRHPAGALRILSAEHSYEEQKTTINCGCLITLLSFKQSTDVKDTEIKPGVSTPRNTIVQKLLQKAGVSSYAAFTLPYPINYPISLQSSYLETVGKLLYSAGYFGWMDSTETFRVSPINLSGNAAIQLQIGGDSGQELWYRRLTSAEAPREIIKVRGTKRLAQIPKYPNSSTTEKYGAASTIDPSLGNSTIVTERETVKQEYDKDAKILTITRTLEQPQGIVLPDLETGKTVLILSEKTIERTYFEQKNEGKLTKKELVVYQVLGAVLAEYVKAREEAGFTVSGKTNTFKPKSVTTDYSYDKKDRTKQIATSTLESLGAILANTNFDWDTLVGIPINLYPSEATIETWEQGQTPQEWTHAISATKSIGRVKPEAIPDDATLSQRIALVANSQQALKETSNSGQTVPPAPERCPPDAGLEDVQTCGEARFSQYGGAYQERERIYSIEYLEGGEKTSDDLDYTTEPKTEDCDDPQCEAIAQIEGKLLYGRFKGQDLGTELHDELFNWRPLMRVNCVEPDGTTRAFALDDSHWYLGGERCICNFGCIWIGDVSAATTTIAVTTTAIANPGDTTIQIEASDGYIPAGTTITIGGVSVVIASDVEPGETEISVEPLVESIPSNAIATYTEEVLNLPYVQVQTSTARSSAIAIATAHPYALTSTTVAASAASSASCTATGEKDTGQERICWSAITIDDWNNMDFSQWQNIADCRGIEWTAITSEMWNNMDEASWRQIT